MHNISNKKKWKRETRKQQKLFLRFPLRTRRSNCQQCASTMFSPHMGRRDKRSNKRVSVNFDPSLNPLTTKQTRRQPIREQRSELITVNRFRKSKASKKARDEQTVGARWFDRPFKRTQTSPLPSTMGRGGGRRKAERWPLRASGRNWNCSPMNRALHRVRIEPN